MTTPDFNPNVPGRGDSIAKSQIDFLNNFMSIFEAFSRNHEPLNSVLKGNHTIVELLEQDAGFQTNTGEITVYTKDTDSTDQIFLRYQGNEPDFQFSTYQIYSQKPIDTGFGGTQTRYFSFLPGRILLYFGEMSGGAPPNAQVLLSPPIATEIITLNMCGNTGLPPTVTIQKETNGKIFRINLFGAAGSFSLPLVRYYFVVAKI